MVSYAWNGKSGAYLDPAQWTPAAVPLYGEDTTAVIADGSAALSDAEPNGITLVLGRTLSQPTLRLSNAAFGPAMTLEVNAYASLAIDGYDTNYGSIVVEVPGGPGFADLYAGTGQYGQFNQYGSVILRSKAGLNFSGTMDNGGLIDLAGGFFNFNGGLLTGTGTIRFSDPYSVMNVQASVGPGQTFALNKGELSLESLGMFQGTVAGFASSAASLSFGTLSFDVATYARDGDDERLVLTRGGAAVGEVRLADTPDTQYAVTRMFGETIVTPAEVYSDGSIPAAILEGTVTVRGAEPDNQAVVLGGLQTASARAGATLVLDNATLGPNLLLTVTSPISTERQYVALTVQGQSANNGEIDVLPSAGGTSGNGSYLTVNLGDGSQFNQDGTVEVISPQTLFNSTILFTGPGILNNDGLIYVGSRSSATFASAVTGAGTITVGGGNAFFSSDAGTQTIDFLGGTLRPTLGLAATIRDWNNNGTIGFGNGPAGPAIDAVAFNQTSESGGDLRLLSGGKDVGDLRLLGTYATSDFKVALVASYETGITVSGHLPGS